MRIATFNINNVNRRLPNLLRWLAATAPNVVCLQELKCTDGDFPVDAIRKAGYHAVWKGERSWNGVAILAQKREPASTGTSAARPKRAPMPRPGSNSRPLQGRREGDGSGNSA